MRGIYILGEGPTEEEFVNSTIRPYLTAQGIYDIRCILMQTSPGHKGGDVTYARYKHNAENLLKREKDVLITSLIDFYRLRTDFPQYSHSLTIKDKIQRVTFLEEAIAKDLNQPRFIPYIQLHEFEGLLFSSSDGFDFLPDIPERNKKELNKVVNLHDNPELLNDGEQTAPSKRLERLIPGYQKTLHSPMIAEVITLRTIMTRCERFKNWIGTLVSKMQSFQ